MATVTHYPFRSAWDDALAPAFGQAAGAAAPGDVTLAVADPADATMDVHALGFNENTEDRVYASIQIPHTLEIPASGNITFGPHVHWTFISDPADGSTVIWKMSYVYAKPGLTTATAGTFAAAPSIVTFDTFTAETGVAEIRKHYITESASDISIPVADCGPSMMFMFTIKLDTTSTVANGKVALLYVDYHFVKGPAGTYAEFA